MSLDTCPVLMQTTLWLFKWIWQSGSLAKNHKFHSSALLIICLYKDTFVTEARNIDLSFKLHSADKNFACFEWENIGQKFTLLHQVLHLGLFWDLSFSAFVFLCQTMMIIAMFLVCRQGLIMHQHSARPLNWLMFCVLILARGPNEIELTRELCHCHCQNIQRFF